VTEQRETLGVLEQRAPGWGRKVGREQWWLIACAAVVVISLLAFVAALCWGAIDGSLTVHNLGKEFKRLWPLSIPTLLGLGAIFVLERVRPANPDQAVLSRDTCLDLLWAILSAPVFVLTTYWLYKGLRWVFDHPLAGLTFDLDDYLPLFIVVGICLVLSDFIAWVYHYMKHRIPFLWRFHSVHHSTEDLSIWSDQRVHLAEPFVNRTVSALPFFVIGGDAAAAVVALSLGRLWYSRFVHSNVRTNMGPLRHLFVTPQYHRVHHSLEPGDADRNLGGLFTVWDRLFGTMVADYDRYPKTGLAGDADVPRPTGRSPGELLRTYWAQIVYPFKSTARPSSLDARSAPVLHAPADVSRATPELA